MKDQMLVCVQCGNPFVFSSSERERFLALDFAAPKRCPDCRKKKAKVLSKSEKWNKDDRKRRMLRRKRDNLYDDE